MMNTLPREYYYHSCWQRSMNTTDHTAMNACMVFMQSWICAVLRIGSMPNPADSPISGPALSPSATLPAGHSPLPTFPLWAGTVPGTVLPPRSGLPIHTASITHSFSHLLVTQVCHCVRACVRACDNAALSSLEMLGFQGHSNEERTKQNPSWLPSVSYSIIASAWCAHWQMEWCPQTSVCAYAPVRHTDQWGTQKAYSVEIWCCWISIMVVRVLHLKLKTHTHTHKTTRH